ncbi:GtrA family protein [Corynebacterium poyangense]|uniref:GtrA family protein n=1 Tax=Corynebacterium poyangense TaxID=2684405 RepID=A0A7H0SS20_9CORY|nr:GtrA family protein [Corynebacterium poyangense]MBZ8177443.1 GtrA family protein [Corynebacterium poyangense]QNQ91345.1 GtrA family protein [Corynebacterium poyangense]
MRFLVSGVIAAVVDLGLTWTLRLGLGFDVVPSRSTGFIFGTLTAYLINRRWTFRAEPSWRRFLAVAVLYGITFGINVGGQKLGEHLFLSWGWAPVFALVVAFVISQGIATVINFIVQRTVIFKVS